MYFSKIHKSERLLKIGRVKLKSPLLDDLVIVSNKDVADILRLCDREGNIVYNDKLFSIYEVLYYPYSGRNQVGRVMAGLDSEADTSGVNSYTPLDAIDLDANPVSFSFKEYKEADSLKLLENRKYDYEFLKERIDCKEGQRLFKPVRLFLRESPFNELFFVTGEKALENLILSNDKGEFYQDNEWLGTIGSIEFWNPRRMPIFITFGEYLEIGRPKYILENEEVWYEPYKDEKSCLTLDVEFEDAKKIS